MFDLMSNILDCKLVDLGTVSNGQFSGVFAPENEVGRSATGVTQQFLDNAEEYHKKYFDTSLTDALLENAIERINSKNEPSTILDIGSGSGPTVISLRNKFPNSTIIASDVSPNLLSILRGMLHNRDKLANIYHLCLDLNKRWFKKECFDLAVGSAILHHLFEPERLISEIFLSIRPGGSMIFFEPFEPGHAFCNQIYRLIIAEASIRKDLSETYVQFFKNILATAPKSGCFPKDPEEYANIDDKWTFTRSYFQGIAERCGATLNIYPLMPSQDQFSNHVKVYLRIGLGASEADVPSWIWTLIQEVESEISAYCLDDLLLTGGIIFTKPR